MMGTVPRIVAMSLVLVALVAGGATNALGGSGSASAPITKTQAVAFADAVNLHAADMPGAATPSPGGERTPNAATVRLARCSGGVSPYRWVVYIHSPAFVVGGGEKPYGAEFEVVVMPTEALAAKDRKAALSAPGFTCFAREVSSEPSRPRGGGGVVHPGRGVLSRLPSPIPGVDASFEWRWTRTNTETLPSGRRIRVRVYRDVLGFVSGPAEVALYTVSLSHAVPATTEKRLLSLLHSRAEAHQL
jgi:hypothetical protein